MNAHRILRVGFAIGGLLLGVCIEDPGHCQDSLPAAFTGSWSGAVHDTSCNCEQVLEAGLRPGSVGDIVGWFDFPCCGGNFRLISVSPEQVELAEEYTYNSCGCAASGGKVTFRSLGADLVLYEWRHGDDPQVLKTGELVRALELYVTEVLQDYMVAAPNGNRLWTKIIQPIQRVYPSQKFPAVVFVPGLLDAGEDWTLNLAHRGFVEIHFNAEGRGIFHRSDGVEDYNGFVHQDDLKAIIEFAATLENVRKGNLGLVTYSYGVTMGSGCLARYPSLEVKYFIDFEGPSDSFVISGEPWALDGDPSNDFHGFAFSVFGHYSLARDPSPSNVEFWSQRQSTLFMGQVRCRYLRIQARKYLHPRSSGIPSRWTRGRRQ